MWLFMIMVCLILQSANTEELIQKRHLNPQGFMTISEIIDYWGYPSEEYEILTADGYYLQANRIPYGVRSPGKTGNRPVVLVVHGVFLEGRSWIANLPGNSLAFVLADAGYDVWILNCRGTTWSRRHQYLSIDEEEFWHFSFHEMGIYDVPATIDFILQKTKQDALYYVGHSQGATVGNVAFSVIPQLAQKVKLFISLAPGYTVVGLQGPFKILVLLPEEIITSRVDVYAGICPDFISVKNELHWNQIYKAQQFQYFDYGCRNKEVYNMTIPPLYKIEDMIVPTAVFYGGSDFFISVENIELLLPRIPHLVFKKYIPSWNHVDFLWGLDAPEHLYSDVVCLMQQYQ